MFHWLIDIARSLVDSGFKVVYISAVRPCGDIQARLQRSGLDTSAFYFVDLVSKDVTAVREKSACLFIKSPSALTDLSISLSAALSDVRDQLAILLDSITALTMHSDIRAVEEFVHTLVSKARVADAKAIVGILEKTDPQELERFAMLCDETLEVS